MRIYLPASSPKCTQPLQGLLMRAAMAAAVLLCVSALPTADEQLEHEQLPDEQLEQEQLPYEEMTYEQLRHLMFQLPDYAAHVHQHEGESK